MKTIRLDRHQGGGRPLSMVGGAEEHRGTSCQSGQVKISPLVGQKKNKNCQNTPFKVKIFMKKTPGCRSKISGKKNKTKSYCQECRDLLAVRPVDQH